jgi:hypothetical protein
MRVFQIPTAKPIEACVKFEYKGYEISLSTGNGLPWLAVYLGASNSPLFICEQTDLLDAIDQAKAFIDNALRS